MAVDVPDGAERSGAAGRSRRRALRDRAVPVVDAPLAPRRPSACARTSARRRARPATEVRCPAASCATRRAERATAGEHCGIEIVETPVRIDVRARKVGFDAASRRAAARRDTAAPRAYLRPGARPRAAAHGRSRRDSVPRNGASRARAEATSPPVHDGDGCDLVHGRDRGRCRALSARAIRCDARAWLSRRDRSNDRRTRRAGATSRNGGDRRPAFRHDVRAPGMEVATGRRRERRGNLAFDRHEGALDGLDLAHFREQRLRVRMIRRQRKARTWAPTRRRVRDT